MQPELDKHSVWLTIKRAGLGVMCPLYVLNNVKHASVLVSKTDFSCTGNPLLLQTRRL